MASLVFASLLLSVIECNAVPNRVQQLIATDLVYQSTVGSTVCESDVCLTAGKTLKAGLNESVDPCDDFYEFACGGWIASHPPVDTNNGIPMSVIYEMQNNVMETIRKAMLKKSSKDDLVG